MIRRAHRQKIIQGLIAVALFIGAASDSLACSVCFGDGKSEMAQAVKAGVIFMAIFIYVLLSLVGAVLATWFFRARKLAALEAQAQATSPSADSPA